MALESEDKLFSSASEEDTDSEDKENDLDYWQLLFFWRSTDNFMWFTVCNRSSYLLVFPADLLFEISLFAKNEVEMNIIEKLDNLDNLDILAVSQFWTILGYTLL